MYEQACTQQGTRARPGVVVVVQRGASSSSVVGIVGAGDGGSSCGGAGVRVGWAVVGAVVWRVSMAKEDRVRAAWREALARYACRYLCRYLESLDRARWILEAILIFTRVHVHALTCNYF